MVFSQTHAWIFTKPTTVGKYSYKYMLHILLISEEVKHIAADNIDDIDIDTIIR